ncbi:MAG: hypothetical protein A3A04_01995 [Candidatus Harrisonbacteria bacterium RIFCSPLOWO2_01_FULL_40_28]|uniref:Endonuclease/exonuclease/phosphatase domain-containing protein n=1 Tax=Candidatus Harrisonbacteria bacterium RIFCSPLOWO2_01_FULL_40_28 TaxID=1798406 RepID=A0A1G1ZKF9_9BACT|nr:MAG: hypothetical protein A3A04_01995 [Candidatus Harrisonbacteria bacterium RIFCSPLOWO2_01_FULL_40_28]
MKIISLNTWGGKVDKGFFDFIKRHQDVDVFCFQEVLSGGKGKTKREELKSEYEDIQNLLTNHIGYFSEYEDGGYYSESSKDLDFRYGIACFINGKYRQTFVEGITLYDPKRKWSDYDGRFAAGASLAVRVSDYAIVNVHGLWQAIGKKDSEARFEQSRKIVELANKTEGEKIICGDFNLEPETKSIKMIEELPATNLIKEYKIVSTRSSLYTKDVKFADYAFIGNKTNVLDFEVLKDEVSDHLPLYLEIEGKSAIKV